MIARSTLAALALCATSTLGQQVSFPTEVLPLLRERCFDCHSATKIKGGLRLDGRGWIELGGDGEDAVLAKNLAESGIYRRVTLPADDPDFMPSKGDALTTDEIATLRAWIEGGAEFGDWVGESTAATKREDRSADPTPFEQRLERIAGDLEPASHAELAKAAGSDAQVAPIADGSPLVRVSFLGSQARVDDARIRQLVPILRHIAILDLGKTRVTDKGIGLLRGAERMVRLDLRQTAVTARGTAQLARLAHLESLNLYGAKSVDDAALAALAAAVGLRRVYVWQTGVTTDGVRALTQARSNVRVVGAPMFPATGRAAAPTSKSPRRR